MTQQFQVQEYIQKNLNWYSNKNLYTNILLKCGNNPNVHHHSQNFEEKSFDEKIISNQIFFICDIFRYTRVQRLYFKSMPLERYFKTCVSQEKNKGL